MIKSMKGEREGGIGDVLDKVWIPIKLFEVELQMNQMN